jgi:hypothetical protein
MTVFRRTLFAAAFAFACGSVPAQTLYKLIDKDGKVTYSEKPPKDFDGKVVPMDIDPNRNTATLPKPAKSEDAPPKAGERKPRRVETDGGKKGVDSADRVRELQDRVDAARKALESARDNPGPDDILRLGTKSGGARPVPSESYARRLTSLEDQLKQAEEELKRAEDDR